MSDFLLKQCNQPDLTELLEPFFDLENSGKRYIVANKEGEAEVCATHIDRFISLSSSLPSKKVEALKVLYEVEATLFDRGVETTQKIFYEPKRCQLHEKIGSPKAACVTVCPVNAITQLDEQNRLAFDHATCVGCGSCVAICPASAIEMSEVGKSTLEEILPLYENSTPLLISRADFEALDLALPEGVVPLVFNSVGFMSEADLLGLFMESGSQVVMFKEKENIGQLRAVDLINEISQRVFGKKAVLWAKSSDELAQFLDSAVYIPAVRKSLDERHEYKRDQFAARLKLLIGDGDFGVARTPLYPQYGVVEVDEKSCTLCMGCVAVCTTSALFVQGDSLMGNFSKCTQCGECVAICPEKSMTLVPSGIPLNSTFFQSVKLAHDVEFCCVECGKPFATNKSIMKIVAMMEPLFTSDPVKAKTLRCCAECKPKVMIKDALQKATV